MAEKRERVAVLIKADSKFFYGFISPNKSEAATLGLELVQTGTPSKDVAFSPKNVKPFSAYKPGVISKGGLCGYGKIASLEAANYIVSRKNPSYPKAGLKSVIVGVRLTPNLVFAWRYRKLAWDVLPAAIKTLAGVALASTYPASEIAYHADGFIFAADQPDLGIPAGTYIGKGSLKQNFVDSATGKNYRLYSGTPPAQGPAVP